MAHLDNISHDCIMLLKIRGNENSPNSLKVMINYHCCRKTR